MMIRWFSKKAPALAAIALLIAAVSIHWQTTARKVADKPPAFPYVHAGLTKRQAAAHLISRFTNGARPGDVDAAVTMGLENWFLQQLNAQLPDDSLNARLAQYDALQMSNAVIANTFPRGGQVLKMAIADSVVSKDSVTVNGRKAYRDELKDYMEQKGYRPEQELFRQLIAQKILRSTYSNNQLLDVMTDFWFNHFNVSITKNDCARYILAYERDAIRPNALGNFGQLLSATAQSPAMLYYLDNFISTGPDDRKKRPSILPQDAAAGMAMNDSTMNKPPAPKKATRGLNENYAREVMELHTLGVNGGYTQKDVTEAARILTGWTVYPLGDYNNGEKRRDRMYRDSLKHPGFVHIGDFVFDPVLHDKGSKKCLGIDFPANGGYEEGVTLLNALAQERATAKFICKKIAVRFVSDEPPQSLVNKMAASFTKSNGDIKAVLLTMVNAPEFWSPTAVRAKIKSPYELAISTVRSLNVDVQQPYQLFNWVTRIGQKIYYYQAPTGFPDKSQYWISTAALLNRMNFGLALAAGQIPGAKPGLQALTNAQQRTNATDALAIYAALMMPARDLSATIKQLTPKLAEVQLPEPKENNDTTGAIMALPKQVKKPDDFLPVVVGTIIGSPEFQRR